MPSSRWPLRPASSSTCVLDARARPSRRGRPSPWARSRARRPRRSPARCPGPPDTPGLPFASSASTSCRVNQSCAAATAPIERLARVGSRPARALGNDDARPPRGLAHGGRVVHAEPLHQPAEHVAALVADEAVVAPLLGNDREVAVGASVERTRPAVIRAGPLELHRLADDPDQVGAVAHLLDGLVGNHAHAENSTMVTPVPP